MLKRLLLLIFLLFISNTLFAGEDEFNTERLPIGNPATKFDFCAVKLNRIFDTNENKEILHPQLIEQLKNFRIIMVGESHTNEHHHAVELNIIKGLYESGNMVCLALEMFNKSQNEALNDYISGKLTEEEFLDKSDYFNTWGHNYRYYKPIFDYARENKIKMFGVNIEHKYASMIGRKGTASLSAEERRAIPEIDTTNIEHRFFIKTAMEGMDAIAPLQFKKIYAAQSLWDAAMGEGAIKVASENPYAIVVLLAGSGHVAYNLGIGKIIKKRSDFPFASVIAIDVPDTVEESIMMKVKRSIKKEKEDKKKEPKKVQMHKMHAAGAMDTTPYKIVIRSLADFLWGVPEEKQEKYPSFGFSVREKTKEGFEVKRVIPETIAEQEGIKRGDIILSIDGKDFPDMAGMKKYLCFKNWGDSITFRILRNDNEIEIKFIIENKKE